MNKQNQWVEFNGPSRGLPKEKRYILLQFPDDGQGMPPAVVVGYLKYAAGDKQSPKFIRPGCGINVKYPSHWNDCLGDDFAAPLWPGKQV